MKTNNKRFLVYNLTDGVLAYPELLTLAKAQGLIWSFPNRFAQQEHYWTASGERIRPDIIAFDIVDTGGDPPLGLDSAVQTAHGGW